MNVFDLEARLTLNTDDYEQGMTSAKTETSRFGDILKGNLASEAIKKGISMAADGIKKIADVTKESVMSFASFEQLVGGIETLYKTSADTVIQYANEAYKTAGMSANQYMETATGFAASLVTSLGGDTAKAAEYANTAITDMSDNANKMGTDIGSLQYAYQGFAKQNYTMLDNLKLGYGGTKSEMERLLDDAEKIKAKQGEVADYSIDSYADIVEAIHVVQEEMGITGTTAAEASGTIEGSLNSAKAAWENLLTGLANGDADVGALFETFFDSVLTAASNIIPAVETALSNIGNLIVSKGPELAQKGIDLILNLGEGIANGIPDIIAKLPEIITGIVGFITNNLPALFQTGIQIIIGIIQGLAQAIPMLIDYAPQILLMIGQGILNVLSILWDNGPAIIQAIGQGVLNSLSALGDLGLHIVTAIAEGILSALGFLGDAIISLFEGGKSQGDVQAAGYRSLGEHAATEATAGLESGAVSFSDAVISFLSNGKTVADEEADGFTGSGGKAGANLTSGWQSYDSLFNTSVSGTMEKGFGTAEGLASTWTVPGVTASQNLALGISSGEGVVDGAVSGAMDSAQSAGEAAAVMFGSVGTSMVTETVSSIAASAQAVSNTARNVIVTAFTVANAATSMFNSVGANIARGIAAGISAGSGAIAAAARSAVQVAVAAAKAAAAISSPSKLFRDEVGVFIGLGVAEGIEDSTDEAVKAAKDLAEKTFSKSQEWLRRQIKFNKLTLSEQLEVWEEIQSQYIRESKQWLQAEEEIFDLREKIQSNFSDDVEKLWKNITDVQDKYADALEDRIESIAGAYKLFDDVQDREAVSGNELTTNLTRQVNVLSEFYDGLDALSKRGVGDAMVEEIRAMGPKAVDQLDALLDMTDDQLSEYVDLYEKKQGLANRVALEELAGMKAETDAAVKENMQSIMDLYEETAPTLGEAFTDGLAKGILDGVPEVVSAAVEASRAALSASGGVLGARQLSFSRSGLGVSSAGIINSMISQGSGDQKLTINLTMADGSVMAKWLLGPLKDYAASKGQPIVNVA